MSTTYRELTKIKELIEELGFLISYPFDDLLFVDSNAFLIQFNDEKADAFFMYFNKDLQEEARNQICEKIHVLAATKRIKITEKGFFQLEQKQTKDDELELKFIS